MKKKVIIVISLIVVLALGGTLVYAATEDGELVNPFSKILGEKVEEGTITEEEATVFSKVWEVVKGEKGDRDFNAKDKSGMKSRGEKPELDEETLTELKAAAEEIKAAVEVKLDEVVSELISEGYVTQEQVDELEDKPFAIWALAKDADEATQEALKEAMTEVKEYSETLISEKIESGELSEETAAFLNGGKKSPRSGKAMCGERPCNRESKTDTDDD